MGMLIGILLSQQTALYPFKMIENIASFFFNRLSIIKGFTPCRQDMFLLCSTFPNHCIPTIHIFIHPPINLFGDPLIYPFT